MKHHGTGMQHDNPLHYQIVRALVAFPRGVEVANKMLWSALLKTNYDMATNKRNAREFERVETTWPGLVTVARKGIKAWALNWPTNLEAHEILAEYRQRANL